MRATRDTVASRGAESLFRQFKLMPFRQLVRITVRQARSDDVPAACAEVAYYTLFAVPPMIVLLTALAALIDRLTTFPMADRLRGLILWNAPGDTWGPLLAFIDNAVERVDSGTASLGVVAASVVAIWSGSRAIMAFIKAFNRAYGVIETRPYRGLRIMALGLAVLQPTVIVGAFALWIFGGQTGRWLAGRFDLGSVFVFIWDVWRWPLAALLFLLLLDLLYYAGPNVAQTFRWISPGSIIATALWFVVVLGFKLYLLVAAPAGVYGAFGSVILLMTLLYLTGATLIIGIELNAVLARRYDPVTIQDLVTDPAKLDRLEAIVEAQQHALELDERAGTNLAERMGWLTSTIQVLPGNKLGPDQDDRENG